MIYHQYNSARTLATRRRRYYFIAGWLGGGVAAIALLAFFAPHLFTPIVQDISRPFAVSRDAATASIGDFFGSFRSKASLVAENASLKNQLDQMNMVTAERNQANSENQDLKNLLNEVPQNTKTVLVRVLEKPGFSPYDTLVIDAGTKNGIAQNDPVYVDQTTILGFVSSVSDNTSTVTLYSTSGQKLNVYIGSTTLETEADGVGGGNFKVQLPRDTTVSVGDAVIMASDPENLVGTVGAVNTTTANSFEQIMITGPVNINTLDYLFIGVGSNSKP